MKKITLWITLAVAGISSGFSATQDESSFSTCECTDVSLNNFMIEFRPSYFYPLSNHFRKIFSGGVDYQLTVSCPVYWGQNERVRGISLFAAADYFSKDGHSTYLKDKTSITIVPVTLGVKYFFPPLGECVPVNVYVASGMKYYFVHTKNHSDYVKKRVNVNGMGGMIEVGAIGVVREHFVLDLFVSSSFRCFGAPSISSDTVESTGINVSSINAGGGVGYRF